MARRFFGNRIAFVEPDGWPMGENVHQFDELTGVDDGRWAIRIETGHEAPLCESLAVKIEYTGRAARLAPPREGGGWRIRGRITYLGDCEPDTHDGCWIYLDRHQDRPSFRVQQVETPA